MRELRREKARLRFGGLVPACRLGLLNDDLIGKKEGGRTVIEPYEQHPPPEVVDLPHDTRLLDEAGHAFMVAHRPEELTQMSDDIRANRSFHFIPSGINFLAVYSSLTIFYLNDSE
ncbi:MAG: hypothetical protein KGI71_03090 [Patescibacteria group bacterium]|nr:hypothetical protein [Patescibacteria group bacterium]